MAKEKSKAQKKALRERRLALAAAYKRDQEAEAKRVERIEKEALLEENKQLKKERVELFKMAKSPRLLVYKKAAWERFDAIACAAASDWHVEEPVDKNDVHGLNEYNLDVAKSRAEFFFKNLLKLTDMMARDTRITTIWIGFLGDFFSGFLHDELVANNILSPGDAAQFVKQLLFSGIDFLLKNSKYNIIGDAIPGNHGRMTHKMWFGDPTGTSLETFMYRSIVDRYHNNPRVQINVSDHAMVYRRFFERFQMRLIHGYEVKYNGGVGGLTIPLNKAIAQWETTGIHADLTVLGHYHQLFDGGNFIVNGSLIGYNTFAQAIKAKYEEPRQAFWLVHARKGGQKSVTAPIWLDAAHKNRKQINPLELL